jgi:hypothetical protein
VSEAFCKAGVVFCIGVPIILAALGLSYVARDVFDALGIPTEIMVFVALFIGVVIGYVLGRSD